MTWKNAAELVQSPLIQLSNDRVNSPQAVVLANALLSAGTGALIGRYICRLTYQQGAVLGATYILAHASLGTWLLKHLKQQHLAIGGSLATTGYAVTFWKSSGLGSDPRINLINTAVIVILSPVLTSIPIYFNFGPLKI